MDSKCCRLLIGSLANVPSPFSRIVATDYYDGPTDGLIECRVCSTIYSFRKLDWDEMQNVRIFSLSPVAGHFIADIEEHLGGETRPRWPVWVIGSESSTAVLKVVDDLLGGASPAEFVVATQNLLGTIEIWRPIGSFEHVDWFRELNLERQSPSNDPS